MSAIFASMRRLRRQVQEVERERDYWRGQAFYAWKAYDALAGVSRLEADEEPYVDPNHMALPV